MPGDRPIGRYFLKSQLAAVETADINEYTQYRPAVINIRCLLAVVWSRTICRWHGVLRRQHHSYNKVINICSKSQPVRLYLYHTGPITVLAYIRLHEAGKLQIAVQRNVRKC